MVTDGRLAVLVHDRLEAEAALGLGAAAGRAVELVVPVGIAGPAFAKALEELLGHQVTAWCDDLPGLALEALRVGLQHIVLEPVTDADALAASRLADLAAAAGAEVRTALPAPLLRVAPNRHRLVPAALGASALPVP